jgi:4-aminobutyrate aminotransferase/(S)-3-amino-2-methylpropionate transaminase
MPRVGERTRSLLDRQRAVSVPMGPAARGAELVYASAKGCNVWDPDGNRYVDLCGGFGALLLGHDHPHLRAALDAQADELSLAMGEVFASDTRILLLSRLSELMPMHEPRAILGLSGADAVTAAIKTCVLATGRSKLIAFEGSYHGSSYAPLSISGLRAGYRSPFFEQLNPHVVWLPFPDSHAALERFLDSVDESVAGVVVEPILGRGGIRPLSPETLRGMTLRTREKGALLVADEIWTGLGRSGQWLWSASAGATADLVCLGKGLGGGLPVSACVGSSELMACWRREPEVVHTQTHAGAPLGAASSLATLDVLRQTDLIARSRERGRALRDELVSALAHRPVQVRGEGLMLGVEVDGEPGVATRVMTRLLDHGYIVSTGGGDRDVIVLTPPLNAASELLLAFPSVLRGVLDEVLRS